MFVYIINCHGKPLMPCQPRKARVLLKAGKAKVVQMVPFTLQLLYGGSGYKQEVSVGIDGGGKHIGGLATTQQAGLFWAEGQPPTHFSEFPPTNRQRCPARRSQKTS